MKTTKNNLSLRTEILEQGTKHANDNWNVLDNPNDHDNSRDDFIAGATWVINQLTPETDPRQLLEQRDELINDVVHIKNYAENAAIKSLPDQKKWFDGISKIAAKAIQKTTKAGSHGG